MFEYRANVISVYDGDTMHLKVDLGCDVTLRMTVRLYGINTPELRLPEGKVARDYVRSLLPTDQEVWVATIKDKREKYGRYLARIYLDRLSMETDEKAYCINDMLVASGNAMTYMVAERRPDEV